MPIPQEILHIHQILPLLYWMKLLPTDRCKGTDPPGLLFHNIYTIVQNSGHREYTKNQFPFFSLLAVTTVCLRHAIIPCHVQRGYWKGCKQGCQSCCAEGPQLTLAHYTAIHLRTGVHGCKFCPLLPTALEHP